MKDKLMKVAIVFGIIIVLAINGLIMYGVIHFIKKRR